MSELSKAKRKRRRHSLRHWQPRMTRAEAVAEVEKTWGERRPPRAPKWSPRIRYAAGPFGDAITPAEILLVRTAKRGGGLPGFIHRIRKQFRPHRTQRR